MEHFPQLEALRLQAHQQLSAFVKTMPVLSDLPTDTAVNAVLGLAAGFFLLLALTTCCCCGSRRKVAPALPLSKRPIDAIWSLWYFIFWFSVMFTDLHNFTASWRGVTVAELEPQLAAEPNRVWPPRLLTHLYYRWARTIDPLLYENPIWWQCIEWVNLLCLMPFSVWAIVGFWKGHDSMRLPGIVVSSFTFYSLIMCMGSTLFGPVTSSDPIMFCAIYVPYLIMPALAIMRLWPDQPFAQPLGWCATLAQWVGTLTTLAVFIAYTLKWFVLCEPTMLPAALLAQLQQLIQLPGGRVCPSAIA